MFDNCLLYVSNFERNITILSLCSLLLNEIKKKFRKKKVDKILFENNSPES
jgi:hypothetical protein